MTEIEHGLPTPESADKDKKSRLYRTLYALVDSLDEMTTQPEKYRHDRLNEIIKQTEAEIEELISRITENSSENREQVIKKINVHQKTRRDNIDMYGYNEGGEHE